MSMALRPVPKRIKDSYLSMLVTYGEDGLFQRCVGQGMIRSADIKDIDVEILDLATSFYKLFKRTGNEKFAIISRAQKRAAHVVYRQLLRINEEKRPNHKRFLTLVA